MQIYYNYPIITKKRGKTYRNSLVKPFVRMKGLEPPRLTTLDPKSSAATNYATCAVCGSKVSLFFAN